MSHEDEKEIRLADLAELFCEELRAGQTPELEDYAKQHPDLADEIRDLFPALVSVEGIGVEATPGEPLALLSNTRLVLRQDGQAPEDFSTALVERLSNRERPFDRFELGEEIARGGQGSVRHVWDEDLGRRLAMKVARGDLERPQSKGGSPSRSLGRFLEEARITAQLDHPGIVPVHEVGLDDQGHVYFTMKLVKGDTFEAVLDKVRAGDSDWSKTRALGVLQRICEAMAYAHSKGVVHRDLKPSNVMVGKFGEVYVMDWGLARLVDVEDAKDLRIRNVEEDLGTERNGEENSRDVPLRTMDGDVIGTPAYMSPEQAEGDRGSVGPPSDIYAVGAMLYHLLSGDMPYAREGERVSSRAIWLLVRKGPPTSLDRLALGVSPELAAICERAMAREPSTRYTSMSELANDLRAYLEHRVVLAFETGSFARFRKWVVRNRSLAGALAATLVAILLGLVTGWFFKAQSDRNAVSAAAERDSVLRLSAQYKLEALLRDADELWPAWPHNSGPYQDWLVEAKDLVAGLNHDPDTGNPGHRDRLAHLEARALPSSLEQEHERLRSHPRYHELDQIRARIVSLEFADEVRRGRTEFEEHQLDTASLPESAWALNALAWPLIAPGRDVFGREAEGLALAQLALEYVEDPEAEAEVLGSIACAYVSLGLDAKARETIDFALSIASDGQADVLKTLFEGLAEEGKRSRGPRKLDSLRQEAAALEKLLSKAPLEFSSDEDLWWYTRLASLVHQLEDLADPETGVIEGMSPEHGWGIQRRLEWARRVEDLTVNAPQVASRWREAIDSIRSREDCPMYSGLTIRPQLGLVPIGRDPVTGLWEFGHPLSGEVPERDIEGPLNITGNTGLVFVLIPGGRFRMGGQKTDTSKPNYDVQAQADESPGEVFDVLPFFLSKYEMTQGQWVRLTDKNPSWANPEYLYRHLLQGKALDDPALLLHPVEQVPWSECMELCTRMGLSLPNEIQWEYAARAGTITSWWTGNARDTLNGFVNLADQTARRTHGLNWPTIKDWPELDDGWAYHAPVDHFPANPFGLHSVHGNVSEWCSNAYDSAPDDAYDKTPSAREAPSFRGGNFRSAAYHARSSRRGYSHNALDWIGLRPARRIYPNESHGAR